MDRMRWYLLLALLVSAGLFPQFSRAAPPAAPTAQDLYSRLPLYFVANQGQMDSRVKFQARIGDGTMAFTDQGLEMALPAGKTGRAAAVRLSPLGMNSEAQLVPMDLKEGKVNYFIGNDPQKWSTDIPTYGALLYRELYPGIDLKFYGRGKQMEYDIIVRPGANPNRVKFSYAGVKGLALTPEGDLAVSLPGGGELLQKRPVIYQEIGGQRVAREGKFKIYRHGPRPAYGFTVAAYDKQAALIIDPVLVYSTFLGGTSLDQAKGIAVDQEGNAYIVGYTQSTDFPRINPYQDTRHGYSEDAFVSKINAAGNALVYSTYLGGTSANRGHAIAVDAAGCAYVTGYTSSANFPTAGTPFQPTYGGINDAFVTKFSPAGNTLVYSSFLGGSSWEWGNGIAVDQQGNAYVTGHTESDNFPTTQGSYQATKPTPQYSTTLKDAFVTKVSPDGTTKVYSTYLGGGNNDEGLALAVDSQGLAYVTGVTYSLNFPTKNPRQATKGTVEDAFVSKLNGEGSDLVFSTYLGGNSYDYGYGIAADSQGQAVVTGMTNSTNFPTTTGVYQKNKKDGYDTFVAKYAPDGSSYVYCTYVGGTASEYGYAVAVDGLSQAYVTGFTYSGDFPTVLPLQLNNTGNQDAIVYKLSANGASLLFSSYLGGASNDQGLGIAVDRTGSIFVTGVTISANFPTRNPIMGYQGSSDAFVTKIKIPTSLSPVYLLLQN